MVKFQLRNFRANPESKRQNDSGAPIDLTPPTISLTSPPLSPPYSRTFMSLKGFFAAKVHLPHTLAFLMFNCFDVVIRSSTCIAQHYAAKHLSSNVSFYCQDFSVNIVMKVSKALSNSCPSLSRYANE